MHSEQQTAWAHGVAHAVKPHHKLSEFETLVQSLGLDENNIEQLAQCPEVVEWVRANYQSRFCPEQLIAKLGIRVTDDLDAAPALCQAA